MNLVKEYQGVIGLEVHVQLSTNTKAFSSDANRFGSDPNTNISEISSGQPGSLPKLNKKVLEYSIKLGLATNSRISGQLTFSRKNYFYTDLPKGYQISQHTNPVCQGGYVPIQVNGQKKKIRLARIHIEEDAGKSIHDINPGKSCIDLNRAGVPLLEIVTMPELSSGEEAYLYLSEIRKLVRYLDICDGDMEKGSLRCDANVSVKPAKQKKLGTRTEIKNLNSLSFVRKAIDYEIKRQTALLQKGAKVLQETLRFNEASSKTIPLRLKEEARDYRYFPEPDLNPVNITEAFIESVRAKMPLLPNELYNKFTRKYHLPEQTAIILSETIEMSGYFEKMLEYTGNAAAAGNWLTGPVRKYLNEHNCKLADLVVSPEQIATLINMVDEGKVSHTAAGIIFKELIQAGDKNILQIIGERNLYQTRSGDEILSLIHIVLARHPEKIEAYKKGKKGLTGFFMGEIMKLSGASVDPEKTTEILKKELEK